MPRADLPLVETDVLVVGAGPTGLMAGLVLARRGLPAIVIDGKPGPTRESRALVVHARSMELYDQLGLADEVTARAYPGRRVQIGARTGISLIDLERMQRGATRFPGIRIFEQSQNEQLLAAQLAAAGAAPRWRHRLIELRQDTDDDPHTPVKTQRPIGPQRPVARPGPIEPHRPVEALVEGPDGLLRIRARWAIGADGASSAVRGGLGIRFEGSTNDAVFWVADVRDVQGSSDEAINLRFGARSLLLVFPLGPGGHARLISMARGDHVDQATALAEARQGLGLRHGEVEWFSTYRIHHRVASHFRRGAVFLAGDAAHVHSPLGGQGMNTGLQDAHDLALLLADVADGILGESVLDRYEAERRPVALTLVAVTDRLFWLVARRSRATGWVRRRAGQVAAVVAPRLLRGPIGRRLGGYAGQYRIHYQLDTGPLAAGPSDAGRSDAGHLDAGDDPVPAWADDPAVGRRLPPVAGNNEPLRSLTWQLHAYGTDVDRTGLPAAVAGPYRYAADPAGRLRPDRAYLVRPDGFVAAALPVRQGRADTALLREALSRQGWTPEALGRA